MGNIMTLLSVAAPLSLMLSLWVMAQISRRFGEVTHRPPLYRGFYVALILLVLPLGIRLLAVGLDQQESADLLSDGTLPSVLYDVPLALSITLAVIIAWRYWGWLVYAHDGQDPNQSRRPEQ